MMRPFAPSKGLRGPEHYWPLMRQAGAAGFTVRDVAGCCNGPTFSTVKAYIKRLRDMGAVEVAGDAPARKMKRATLYRVKVETINAPVSRRPEYTGKRGLVQELIWQTMRDGVSYDLRKLAVEASTDVCPVSYSAVRTYVGFLVHAGIVVGDAPMTRSVPGQRPGAVGGVYRLRPAANTGPKPPKVIGRRVWDANTEAFVGEAMPARAERRAAARAVRP